MLCVFRLSTRQPTPVPLTRAACGRSAFQTFAALELAIGPLAFGYMFLIIWIII